VNDVVRLMNATFKLDPDKLARILDVKEAPDAE
jgi:hypothetical protein